MRGQSSSVPQTALCHEVGDDCVDGMWCASACVSECVRVCIETGMYVYV